MSDNPKKKSPVIVIIAVVIGILLLCGVCSVGGFILIARSGSAVLDEIESDIYTDTPSDSNYEDLMSCTPTEDFQDTYRNPDVSVIMNPCEVIWLLAEEEESYTLKTNNGTTIYVIVWRNWENNTTPGKTFTIRGLDVEDSSMGLDETRNDSGILVTRWVENEAGLAKAKNEIRDAIEELDY